MTYTELLTNLAELLDRTDLTAQLPFFVEQAESQFTAAPEEGGIRHWRDKKRAVVTVEEQYLTIPPGYVETIRMHNRSTGDRMELLSREAMQEARRATNDRTGIPSHYRHGSDGTFALWPTPSGATQIELEYYARIPRLNKQDYGEASPVTSNWLSDKHPNVYLYGAAMASAPYLHDDARMQTWSGLYSLAAAQVNGEAKRAESSTSSPRLRNRGLPTSRTPGSQNRYLG